MRLRTALFLMLVFLLAACVQAAPIPYPPSNVEPPTSQPYPVATGEPFPYPPPSTTIIPSPTSEISQQIYTDPDGQFRLSLPEGWVTGEEQGLFRGPDGILQVGYLPEMAFMNSAQRVCERLANTPQGPARIIGLSPLPTADACTLTPLPEMSTDRVMLVVNNAGGNPEQRYFYLVTDRAHLEEISASLELLNTPDAAEAFPYPTGAMRPEDEAFWEQPVSQPEELTVKEYTVVEASVDSPTHFEFLDRIPEEVFEKRDARLSTALERRLSRNNALLEPFGYSLQSVHGSETQLYALYKDEQQVQGEISNFREASVDGSGSDFALVVELWSDGFRLVQNGRIQDWDMGASLYTPPVFHGDQLLNLYWDDQRSQVQVMQGQEQLYAFASLFMVDIPAKGLWSWEGHWLLEVDGFLIQDGENLNERLGYEEIFGWQLLDGKPFYYFRKGPRVGISYDGDRLPVYYEEIVHYRCCEPGAFNNAGSEDMAWFYGLRDGTWYYVEIGKHEQ
jgi:hypothetical protein